MKRKISRLFQIMIAVVLMCAVVVPVSAATISELEDQQKEHQDKLDEVNSQIVELEDEQQILEEEISDLDSEIVNMFTSIELLEEQIEEKNASIETLTAEIAVVQADYELAKAEEETQYEAMKVRIKYMYEQGDTAYVQMLMEAGSFSDMLNKADYIEQLQAYDRKKLEEYQLIREEAEMLKVQLETEKAALEAEIAGLETDKADLEEQKEYMDTLLAEKKEQSDNYEAQIAQAKQQAAIYKTQIKEEQEKIDKLKEEEKKKEEEQAKAEENGSSGDENNGTSGGNSSSGGSSSGGSSSSAGTNSGSTGGSTSTPSGGGSVSGTQIANYACQYIGNPYVSGGTSLTNGADCSGFVYRVYSDFGYQLPRTSYAQRSAGYEVSYANAQPGDIICYSGHVGIYIGNGKIVHASTPATGIKIGNATYREILTVRRIL